MVSFYSSLRAGIMVLLCCTAISISLYSQKSDFGGIWILKEHKSITGTDYANGLPLQIKINQEDNRIDLEIKTIDGNGKEITSLERLFFGGKAFETITESKRKKSVSINWISDNTKLFRTIIYSLPDNEKVPDIEMSEIWSLREEQNTTTLSVLKSAKSTIKGDEWSMEGTYKKVTQQELEIREARGSGIQFSNEKNWEEVVKKAKRENKYIFVDFYATWCNPCKKMEDVYSLNVLGKVMNGQFVSIKVQADSTANDNGIVRSWYADSRYLQEKFIVNAFPTFLFFTPEGRIVHRGLGFMESDDFIELVKAATDPEKQYYTCLDNYRQGIKDYRKLGGMALLAQRFGDENLAGLIARDYIDNYLYKVDSNEVCSKENLIFLESFPQLISLKNELLSVYLLHADKVDGIMGKGYSEWKIKSVIVAVDVNPQLYKNVGSHLEPITKRPNWNLIRKIIEKKYNSYFADLVLLEAKLSFLLRVGDGPQYVRIVNELIARNPPKNNGQGFSKALNGISSLSYDYWALNQTAWNAFLYFKDKNSLEKAIEWTDLALKLHTDTEILDTKAHLLYKMGKIKEAIFLIEQAIVLAPKVDRYRESLKKMQDGKSLL